MKCADADTCASLSRPGSLGVPSVAACVTLTPSFSHGIQGLDQLTDGNICLLKNRNPPEVALCLSEAQPLTTIPDTNHHEASPKVSLGNVVQQHNF